MSDFRTTETARAVATNHLQELRARLLEGILRGVLVIWLVALAAGTTNVLQTYARRAVLYANPEASVAGVIGVYIAATIIFFITFNRRLGYNLRAGILLALLYGLGTFTLLVAALRGDGRIFFRVRRASRNFFWTARRVGRADR
jgi:hypothetical protein